MISCTGAIGSVRRSILTQFLRAVAPSDSPFADEKTTPGLSKSFTCLSKIISFAFVVIPGVFPVAAEVEDLVNALMMEDLPTFGNPTMPTVIDVLIFLFLA
mgnify:FL=1|jgi:hypothetical protein